MELLDNVIQEYAWGSRRAIAELLGRPSPSERPQAELWMGAHPSAPSKVRRGGQSVSLLKLIEEAPAEALGPRSLESFGPRLPFLLKVLAAGTPLSLQAHPSAEQARRGFAREEAAGLPRSAPNRNYKDPNHKPELLCALTPFEALCGFRPAGDTLRLLQALGCAELGPLASRLAAEPDLRGVRAMFEGFMSLSHAERGLLVEATLSACSAVRDSGGPFAAECAWAVQLGGLYPGDVGAVSALLLNLVSLQPGEAIYLPAGNLHAYLEGVGVEIMANSDNVLRGGLTPKHVDVPELLSVLDFADRPVTPLKPRPQPDGEEVYVTAAAEFRLSRLVLAGGSGHLAKTHGPEILLCTQGSITLRGGSAELPLPKGASAWIPASEGEYELQGQGAVFRATIA
ncbi:MAG: mannose-6-phosphate isomerase, class I [Myxococcaceae bacterium]